MLLLVFTYPNKLQNHSEISQQFLVLNGNIFAFSFSLMWLNYFFVISLDDSFWYSVVFMDIVTMATCHVMQV